MNSYDTFHWCLYKVLCPVFKIMFIDISKGKVLNKHGFVFVSLTFVCAVASCVNGCRISILAGSNVDAFLCIFGVTMALQVFIRRCREKGFGYIAFSNNTLTSFKIWYKYICLWDLRKLMEVVNFIEHTYKTMPNHPACCKFARLTETFVKILMTYYVIIMGAMLMLFVVWPFINDSGSLILPMIVPGTDPNTTMGSLICICYQIPMCPIAGLIMYGSETLIVMIFVNMPMISSIITYSVHELETAIKNGNKSNSEIRSEFISIILLHKKYNEYEYILGFLFFIYTMDRIDNNLFYFRAINNIQQGFFIICLFQISSAFICVIMTSSVIIRVSGVLLFLLSFEKKNSDFVYLGREFIGICFHIARNFSHYDIFNTGRCDSNFGNYIFN